MQQILNKLIFFSPKIVIIINVYAKFQLYKVNISWQIFQIFSSKNECNFHLLILYLLAKKWFFEIQYYNPKSFESANKWNEKKDFLELLPNFMTCCFSFSLYNKNFKIESS